MKPAVLSACNRVARFRPLSAPIDPALINHSVGRKKQRFRPLYGTVIAVATALSSADVTKGLSFSLSARRRRNEESKSVARCRSAPRKMAPSFSGIIAM